jgi:hypothetical protein
MPRVKTTVKRRGPRLSYANVMATLAVFLGLGGGAYAAVSLPARSVEAKHIKRHAVTRPKLAARAVDTHQLARRAVTLKRLSRGVRARLNRVGRPGPQGPRGPAGPAGPSARRIDYRAAATASPSPTTVLDVEGFHLAAACVLDAGNVRLDLTLTSSEDAIAQDMFSVDQGTDPGDSNTQTGTSTGNVQIPLSAGVPFAAGIPAVTAPSYLRSIATVIVTSASRTITLNVAAIADADPQQCSVAGTAVSATTGGGT